MEMSNILNKNTLCLLAVIIISGFSINALAQEEDRRPRPRRQMDDGQQMGERMLKRIAENDPEKADQLRKLLEEDPEKFREQMHQYMQEKHGQRGQGQERRRPEHPQGQRVGGMMGGPGKGPRQDGRGPEHGGGMMGGQGRGWRQRIQKQHEEFVEWLGKNYPKVAENLEKLKEQDPVEYMRKAGEKLKKYGEIMEAEKKNPEYAKVLKEDLTLKQARDKIIRKFKTADGKQKKQLKAELKEIVAERFDIVIKKKEFKYKALKQKLEKLQKQVTKRQAELDKLVQSKDKAIAERMNELVGESEKLNWE